MEKYKNQIKKIYQSFHSYLDYGHKKGLTDESIKDAFQEALYRVFKKIDKDNLVIETTLEQTVFGFFKFVLLEKVRAKVKGRIDYDLDGDKSWLKDNYQEESLDYDFDIYLPNRESELGKKLLKDLGDSCKQLIIDFFWKEKDIKLLAEELSIQERAVSVKKTRCYGKLRKALVATFSNKFEAPCLQVLSQYWATTKKLSDVAILLEMTEEELSNKTKQCTSKLLKLVRFN